MKLDKKIIIIIIMGIIILAGAGVMADRYISQKAYQQGIQDATLLINQQILNSLTQSGYVPFVYILDNETQTINLVPYQNE